MMKICGVCLKEIKKGENHIKVILIENEKETETKYAHLSCWRMEFDKRKVLADSLRLLNKVKGIMQPGEIEVIP